MSDYVRELIDHVDRTHSYYVVFELNAIFYFLAIYIVNVKFDSIIIVILNLGHDCSY